ncbi:indole-diterpene biosynthesis protein-like protein PaxU [Clohesyomyces aquaticus]|uniref:Indole-diterpene biosynthesis protein-like protein PaxU n=1 Tax=Clohesyomyces aquaticus TaxID=1231657 RepID=A0A1Y1ZDC4_9PLEO|nr:indole-diterpene biosynthesis protein-like protein PaxU [Clohesyomyces aquaticus]
MASPVDRDIDPIFSKLAPHISLYSPPNPAPGELIILCTWLGAAKKHILKYVREYRNIAPRARILLIESSVFIIASPYNSQRKAIQPAAHIVRAVLDECGAPCIASNRSSTAKPNSIDLKPNIMIHTFSNGGTNSATHLLIVLHHDLSSPLPVIGIICDSGPARGTYRKSFQSMLLSLPKSLFWRIVGPIIVSFVINVLFGSQFIGWEKPERLYRRTLLDGRVVDCRRICYVFSKKDDHVDWEDVTSHAEEARGKGWEVREVECRDTEHCNHIQKYRMEYFEAVRRVWEGGVLEGGSEGHKSDSMQI